MATLEEAISRATAPGSDMPLVGGVMMAATKDGIAYSKSFGLRSINPKSPVSSEPFTPDTTLWIASITKLLTAVSALQCVEKGLLSLDDDISNVVEEWKTAEILVGFEDNTGKPITRKANNKITLRMLLSHQSGMGYTFLQPGLKRFQFYREKTGTGGIRPIPEMYHLPLLYEPGTSWSYSVGIDWAGQMVERVTNKTLGAYMEENIWKPLGINSMTFHLSERPDIKSRLADMSVRTADGTLVHSPTKIMPENIPDDHGGGGLYSSAADYIKLLISILKNDGTLLTPASMDVLFAPCLSPGATKQLREDRGANYAAFRQSKAGTKAEKRVIQPDELNYSVGGQIAEVDWTNGRKAGSMNWSGASNVLWTLDRKSDIALLYFSQLAPPSDSVTKALFERFEYAVYNGELGSIGSVGSQ